ncbi:MAG: hypothetical protein M3143_02240 [Actinomycetota bacterium]|nr:hypothetical protein [Actinomycetota bacterium]
MRATAYRGHQRSVGPGTLPWDATTMFGEHVKAGATSGLAGLTAQRPGQSWSEARSRRRCELVSDRGEVYVDANGSCSGGQAGRWPPYQGLVRTAGRL